MSQLFRRLDKNLWLMLCTCKSILSLIMFSWKRSYFTVSFIVPSMSVLLLTQVKQFLVILIVNSYTLNRSLVYITLYAKEIWDVWNTLDNNNYLSICFGIWISLQTKYLYCIVQRYLWSQDNTLQFPFFFASLWFLKDALSWTTDVRCPDSVVTAHLCYTDTGTGIGYDTYRIRGYALSQKTLIRGYG